MTTSSRTRRGQGGLEEPGLGRRGEGRLELDEEEMGLNKEHTTRSLSRWKERRPLFSDKEGQRPEHIPAVSSLKRPKSPTNSVFQSIPHRIPMLTVPVNIPILIGHANPPTLMSPFPLLCVCILRSPLTGSSRSCAATMSATSTPSPSRYAAGSSAPSLCSGALLTAGKARFF